MVITLMIGVVGNLHHIMLKITKATFLPAIVTIGQYLTKLLQKQQVGRFYLDTV